MWQKEYETRHCEGKMIYCELCKKLKFHRTNKRFVIKSESVTENEKHKIIWDLKYKQITKSWLEEQT